MGEPLRIRKNIEINNSTINRIFSFKLEDFPLFPEFEIIFPGPDPAQDALALVNENAFRVFMQSILDGTYSVPVTQVNDNGIATKTFPAIMKWSTLSGDYEYENFTFSITLDTTGRSINEWSVSLAGTDFRGSPPSQTVIAVDSLNDIP